MSMLARDIGTDIGTYKNIIASAVHSLTEAEKKTQKTKYTKTYDVVGLSNLYILYCYI